MLLIAATAYNQSSRRTTNNRTATTTDTQTATRSNNESVSRTRNNTSANRSSNEVRNSNQTRSNRTSTATSRNNNSDRSEFVTNNNSNGGQNTNSNTQRNITTTRTARTTNNRAQSSYTARTTNSSNHTSVRANHTVYQSPRTYTQRHAVSHYYRRAPEPREYRAVHYAYRAPVHVDVIWTPVIHNHYIRIYPFVTHWNISYGYHIRTISAYDTDYYRGDFMNVYGRVTEVFYSHSTDEYFLYFGPYYPYHDFTVVIPGYIARHFSRRPERYFTRQHIVVTGLITEFNGKPEIVVRESFQLRLY